MDAACIADSSESALIAIEASRVLVAASGRLGVRGSRL